MGETVSELKIKNCPFCEGPAETSGYDYAYHVRCMDRTCIASSHGLHYETAEDAAAAWNRRSTPDAVVELVEAAYRLGVTEGLQKGPIAVRFCCTIKRAQDYLAKHSPPPTEGKRE